jgi:sarcosine oxidase
MMSNHYDVIVIGVGSMGSAACYQLARAGVNVLGFEQFSIPNQLSSHTGQSRIIRKAYFEHPDYVPLLQRAYALWKEIEEVSGTKVYYETGLLYLGPPDHAVMTGVKSSAATFNIPLEIINASEARDRYPQLIIPDDSEVLFEPEAGFLRPELSIQVFANAADEAGATLLTNCRVLDWTKTENGYIVNTTDGTFTADKIIITAGPWIDRVLPAWNAQLRITRQVIAWMKPIGHSQYSLDNFPCWVIAEDNVPGVYYGFPQLPADQFEPPFGLKLAHHHPGTTTDPGEVDRTTSAADIDPLVHVANRYFSDLDTDATETKVCMYTNTEDENFIIDFVEGHGKDVIVATGFSGHGFKFVSVIGEILKDLVIHGSTSLPIEFLQKRI